MIKKQLDTVFLLIGVLASSIGYGETKEGRAGVGLQKKSEATTTLPSHLYAYIELRHHLNTFYDAYDHQQKQEPAFHGRFILGSRFREGLFDFYTTWGIIKGPHSRQLVERRPEIELDIYPLVGDYGQIVQYNLVQLPFSEEKYNGEKNVVQQGTTYTLGLAPTGIIPLQMNGTQLRFKVAADLWTQFFSREQYQNNETRYQEPHDQRYALSESQEERPDYAQRYYTEYMTGFDLVPAWLTSIRMEMVLAYDIYYLPVYYFSETGEENYRYTADRSSFYRFRMEWTLNERWELVNDFYEYFGGLYANKVRGDERRFRNVMRLSYKL